MMRRRIAALAFAITAVTGALMWTGSTTASAQPATASAESAPAPAATCGNWGIKYANNIGQVTIQVLDRQCNDPDLNHYYAGRIFWNGGPVPAGRMMVARLVDENGRDTYCVGRTGATLCTTGSLASDGARDVRLCWGLKAYRNGAWVTYADGCTGWL
jgi:hypothetical protein